MLYTSGPGFDSQWRPNIFNSVLFKKACERERIHLIAKLCHSLATPLNIQVLGPFLAIGIKSRKNLHFNYCLLTSCKNGVLRNM